MGVSFPPSILVWSVMRFVVHVSPRQYPLGHFELEFTEPLVSSYAGATRDLNPRPAE